MQRNFASFLLGSLVTLLGLAACGSEPAPMPTELVPGIEGGLRTGPLEVFVVDEETGAALSGARVRSGAIEATTDASGRASLALEPGAVTLEVQAAGHRAQTWSGITGARAIVSVIGEESVLLPVSGELRGLAAAGATSAFVGASAPVRIVRPETFGAADAPRCELSGEGCGFTLRVAPGIPHHLAAVLVDGAGAPVGIAVRDRETLGPDPIVIDAAIESGPTETLSVNVPDPGESFAAVVGVPGLAIGGDVVLLPQTSIGLAQSLAVPALDGLAESRYWGLFETSPMLGGEPDRSARSVLFARDLRDGTSAPWAYWLDIPELSVDTAAGTVRVEPISGARLLVIDSLDADGRALASVLHVGELTVASTFALGATDVDRVIVRAIDTGARPEALSLRDAELAVMRFSERTVSLSAAP